MYNGLYKIIMPRKSVGLIFLVRCYPFLKNYITSEGAISHNVLHYQHLSIARYQASS